VATACDAKIAALERESALLDELFRALLEELMTGRVSVAGVEDDEGLPPMYDAPGRLPSVQDVTDSFVGERSMNFAPT
jgi:hypothetical protein